MTGGRNRVIRTLPRLLLLAALLRPVAAGADDRPTVALALGGGATRGFAHIGVLKWMDEHRIPIDGIAGTSIGALVGGGYAAGLSVQEIETIVTTEPLVRTFDWNDLYAARDYRDKITARRMPRPLVLPFVGDPPLGLNAGQRLWLLFSRMVFPVSDVESFDDLPIPFRAIAVDLITAEERVFEDGNLATAMRASMSVPLLFHPAPVDGSVYVDGGTRNTVPANRANEFGADVVIGVDVSPGLKSREDLTGPHDVLGQAATVPVRANIERAKPFADVWIRPAVDDYGPGEFGAIDTLIDLGYRAMAERGGELAELSVSEAEYRAWRAERARVRAERTIGTVDFVDVALEDDQQRESVEGALADLVGRAMDFDALERRLTRLCAQGHFHALHYERATRGDQTGVRILGYGRGRTAELSAQLTVNATELDASGLGLDLRSRIFDVIGRDSEWLTDLRLGQRFVLHSELYAPVVGATFLSLYGEFEQRERGVFAGGDRVGDARRRRSIGGLDVGLGSGWRTQEWRAGIVFDREVIDGTLGEGVTNGATARLQFGFDRTDNATIPRRGLRGFVRARHGFHRSFTDAEVNQVEARWAGWIPVGHHAIVARVEGGVTLDRDAPDREVFALGGPLRLGGLRYEELRGSNYEFAALGWQQRLGTDNPYASLRLLLMVETGAVHADGVDPQLTTNASVNLLTETPIGNLVAGVAGNDAALRAYVTFGIVPF